MKIYEAKLIYNNGGWNGCFSDQLCLTTTPEKAMDIGISKIREIYPDSKCSEAWDKNNYEILDKKYTSYAVIHNRCDNAEISIFIKELEVEE